MKYSKRLKSTQKQTSTNRQTTKNCLRYAIQCDEASFLWINTFWLMLKLKIRISYTHVTPLVPINGTRVFARVWVTSLEERTEILGLILIHLQWTEESLTWAKITGLEETCVHLSYKRHITSTFSNLLCSRVLCFKFKYNHANVMVINVLRQTLNIYLQVSLPFLG